jgi:DNA-directed RNA polymerase subunit RPC12/RpoP
MTTIHVPYVCDDCKNQFDVTMKAGEPLMPRTCPKCGGIANTTVP